MSLFPSAKRIGEPLKNARDFEAYGSDDEHGDQHGDDNEDDVLPGTPRALGLGIIIHNGKIALRRAGGKPE